jgi:hypothetical protein
MRSKILISSIILSFSIVASCDMIEPKSKYQLKDTWGEDGNWGKQTRMAAKKTEAKPAEHKETKKEEPKHEEAKGEATKQEEAKPEETKQEETKPEEAAGSETKTAAAYENAQYGYSVMPAADWQQHDTFGSVNAYYVKDKDGTNLDFSVGAVKNLREADLNAKFKDAYLKRLTESFPKLEMISNKDQTVNGQKAWAIDFNFDKGGKKLHQKQVFIPHKDNTLVMNWVSTEEGFFKGEEDFNEISKNVKLN